MRNNSESTGTIMAEEYITEAHQLPPGTVLHGRFEIRRVIGEGGFGITYEGRDQVLDARVAIKEYYMTGFVNRNTAVSLDVIPSVGEKAETFRKNREKFYSEAMVLAKFGEEDGIVRIQDYFQENETAYIVMEYLDGGTLKDRLNKDGAMNWEEALDLLMPGMVSLEHVHEAGICPGGAVPQQGRAGPVDGRLRLLRHIIQVHHRQRAGGGDGPPGLRYAPAYSFPGPGMPCFRQQGHREGNGGIAAEPLPDHGRTDRGSGMGETESRRHGTAGEPQAG